MAAGVRAAEDDCPRAVVTHGMDYNSILHSFVTVFKSTLFKVGSDSSVLTFLARNNLYVYLNSI